VLEHFELGRDQGDTQVRPAQHPEGAREVVLLNQPGGVADLGDRELQPQLGRLMHSLEEELVAMGLLLRRLL
jgi:hypothetical protein